MDGLARMLGGSDPGKEKDEIMHNMQSNKATLLPIGQFGYVLSLTTTDDAGDSGSVSSKGNEEEAGPTKHEEKLLRLTKDVGSALEHIKSLTRNKACRPFLAQYHMHPWKVMEVVFGTKISNCEYNNIKVHAKYPGAFQPVKEVHSNHCKVNSFHLRNVCKLLDGDSTQKYAFGTQLQSLFNGTVIAEFGNVDQMKKAKHLAAEYIIACDDEAQALASDMSIPDTLDRCQRVEKDTFWRCLCARRHTGRCKFTPKGSICKITIQELIECLTADDIKSLSGLDDIKVEKGRDNFIRL
jgi:hypothetical protein